MFSEFHLHTDQDIFKFEPTSGNCYEGYNQINIYQSGQGRCMSKMMGFSNYCNKNEIVIVGNQHGCNSGSLTRFLFLFDKTKLHEIEQARNILNSNNYSNLSEVISIFKLY